MRIRYVSTELGAGLKRNVTMTVAVIVTVWISLVLFGIGLLIRSEVSLINNFWSDKVQIQVFMCNAQSGSVKCDDKDVTPDERQKVKQTLEESPEVAGIDYESRKEAFKKYQESNPGSATEGLITEEGMQDSFKVSLKDPTKYESTQSAVEGLDGVQSVENSRGVIDPLLRALNGLQWIAIGLAGGLLVAGILQIGNTIRLTVFSRRREIGIMRLVGASNFYIQLPFILESVVAAMIGALLACGTLAFTPLVTGKLSNQIGAFPWIGVKETVAAMPILVGLGILLAVAASLITLRRHLRV